MNNKQFIYTYGYPEEEQDLCYLEMRAFFGYDSQLKCIKSDVEIEPSRSPFIRERIDVLYEEEEVTDIARQVRNIDLGGATFKVIFVNYKAPGPTENLTLAERQQIERDIGWEFTAEFDLHQPDYTFGIIRFNDRWYFGKYMRNEAVWLQHVNKPQSYSTALGTRMARAVANIAVPNPNGVTAIDPCCGIGNVLVEALSMRIDIVGRDINPLVTRGSRENIAFFGYTCEVTTGSIADVTAHYDVAVIDLPYNIFTHTSLEEQLAILKHARRIADRVIVVTIDTIDHLVEAADFQMKDRCIAKKGKFSRQILVCE